MVALNHVNSSINAVNMNDMGKADLEQTTQQN